MFIAIQQGMEPKRILLIGLLFMPGGWLILRSLSERMSRQDAVESSDKRKKLVRIKARSSALSFIEWFCAVCSIGCMLAYNCFSGGMFVGMSIAFLLVLIVMPLVELICVDYHQNQPQNDMPEDHNP